MNKLTFGILMLGVTYALFKFFNVFGLEGFAEYQIWLIMLWVISPFFVLAIASKFLSRAGKQQRVILTGAVAITGVAIYCYCTMLTNYIGDKQGLIFIGVPIYQWVVLIIVFGSLLLLKRMHNQPFKRDYLR